MEKFLAIAVNLGKIIYYFVSIPFIMVWTIGKYVVDNQIELGVILQLKYNEISGNIVTECKKLKAELKDARIMLWRKDL